MHFGAFVKSRMRNLRNATTPWIRYGKRKLDRRAADDPLRKVRLRARGRRYLRDSSSTKRTETIWVVAMAVMAMSIGYRVAHYLDFDMAGTLLAPEEGCRRTYAGSRPCHHR